MNHNLLKSAGARVWRTRRNTYSILLPNEWHAACCRGCGWMRDRSSWSSAILLADEHARFDCAELRWSA